MAAITVDKPRSVSIPGYEVNDVCVLAEDVNAGDLLSFTGNMVDNMPEMEKAPAGNLNVDGIALQDGYNGQRGFDVGVQGEMDGFDGLTPGTRLYLSGSNDGEIDDTDPGGNAVAQIKAVTDTRIRFNFDIGRAS